MTQDLLVCGDDIGYYFDVLVSLDIFLVGVQQLNVGLPCQSCNKILAN